MAWTNERLKLSCTDGIGLKTLWKMIVLDNHNSSSKKQQKNVSIFIRLLYIIIVFIALNAYCIIKRRITFSDGVKGTAAKRYCGNLNIWFNNIDKN